MKTRWQQLGAVFAALLASSCCWLPPLLVALGLSGGAITGKLAALRPLWLLLTLGLLIWAWRCRTGCCEDRKKRLPLILTAIAVFALALVPGWRPASPRQVADSADARLLQVDGMTCQACADSLQARLLEDPQIPWASADADSGELRIPSTATLTDSDLQKLIAEAGFTLRTPQPNPPKENTP